jgi:hypothetical protein
MFALCYTSEYFLALSCFLSAALLIISPSTLQGKEIPAGTYSYRETMGEVTTYFYWQLEEQEQQRIVTVHEKKKSFVNLCSVDGATWRWQLKDTDNNHDIIAERQGDELKISGVRYGEVYEETVELDERPWFQPLSYSLRNFLGSEEESMSFWTIRTDTVEATTLQVKKAGEEEIPVNGKKIMAQRVELRAEGFFSHFWHGTYWFRKSDKLFLMYRSVHGSPGTLETVVELTGEP